jgi:hypothetical protein
MNSFETAMEIPRSEETSELELRLHDFHDQHYAGVLGITEEGHAICYRPDLAAPNILFALVNEYGGAAHLTMSVTELPGMIEDLQFIYDLKQTA